MSIGPLNLGDADLKGFEAVEAGRYNAEVAEMTVDAVKNEGGKTPVGTPIIKVRYRLLSDLDGTTDGIEGKSVFQSLVVPPKDYDAKKAAIMKGMIARLFIALGVPEEVVTDKKKAFEPEFEDYVGNEVQVTVSREPKKDRQGNIVEGEFNNSVKGVKPAGTAVAGGGLL
jgi:Protein of unknown function (DUF669)